ncbi:hypothetical protein Z945_3334 [Sulfitobacter noctilucae]|nr:hypothetical protein Z945_3334 [Sulfitobacter noctilucae]
MGHGAVSCDVSTQADADSAVVQARMRRVMSLVTPRRHWWDAG